MSEPAISVLMITHNQGDLLRVAVRSMLDQTWRDLEVVVVDNGVSDGSVDALAAEVGDPRLRIVRLPTNTGIAAGLNHGVPHCRARLIALMDSDDISHPRRLELQLAVLAAEPELTGVSCDARMIDTAGRPIGEWRSFHAPEDIRRYAAYNMPLHHPGMLMRREIVEQVPYRTEFELASDFDFMSRAVHHGRFASLPVLLYDYRRHPGSATVARETSSMISRCVVRVAAARRAAGRPESLDELTRVAATQEKAGLSLERIYRYYAAQCRREGFGALACLHAALAMRERPGLTNAAGYGWSLLRALINEPAALPAALHGLMKGPFWLLLKRRGFPAFPRY